LKSSEAAAPSSGDIKKHQTSALGYFKLNIIALYLYYDDTD